MRSTELGVRAAAAAVRSGEVTAAALVEACLDRIRAVDPAIKAWIHLDETGARAAARAADAAVRPGATLGVLHGVPIGVKDIIDVAGMPTTAGARAFAHTRPTRDATCVARLRAAGAIVLGKTHTTQFAYRDPAPTANPWNPAHTPGGSSSGSAAAVAARTVPVALGSQTVGSILRPAAYTGIVGLKGTNGLVPLDGVVPLGYSLDHIGPLARSVEDAALVLSVMAGRSPAAAPAGLAWTGDASLCQPWSTIGAPSISLPSGVSGAGLPFALQLAQAPGADTRLLGAAVWCERTLGPAAAPPLPR